MAEPPRNPADHSSEEKEFFESAVKFGKKKLPSLIIAALSAAMTGVITAFLLISNAREEIPKLKEQVGELKNNYASVFSTVQTVRDNKALKGDQGPPGITPVEISAIKNDIARLQSDVSARVSGAKGDQGPPGITPAEISTIRSDIARMQSDMSARMSGATSLNSDSKSFQTFVGSTNTSISALQQELSATKDRLSDIEKALAELKNLEKNLQITGQMNKIKEESEIIKKKYTIKPGQSIYIYNQNVIFSVGIIFIESGTSENILTYRTSFQEGRLKSGQRVEFKQLIKEKYKDFNIKECYIDLIEIKYRNITDDSSADFFHICG